MGLVMIEITPDDIDKVEAYLTIIKDRILAPIQNTDIQQFCTATLLLLFAAIDGLGKLLHQDKCARPGKRIEKFLDFMGGDYSTHKPQLLKLRHSLVHNAINLEAFLSNDDIEGNHLEDYQTTGFVFINTVIFVGDFVETFERFRVLLQQDPTLMKRAANRLLWIDPVPLILDPDIPTPSPPARVQFINFNNS